MAGGRVETDPEKLAGLCESFQVGVKKLYESGPTKGDMWFYELYHLLTDCAASLRKSSAHTKGKS